MIRSVKRGGAGFYEKELERSFLLSPNEVLSLVKVSLEANLTEEEEPQWRIKGAGLENDHGMVDPCWRPCRALFRRRPMITGRGFT